MSESDRAINRAIKNFAKTLSPKGFHIVGLGGGLDHESGKHKQIDIVLGTSKEICDVRTARVLLVETITEFLNYINTREDIKAYLATTPFTIENIHVGILCEHSTPPNIGHMFNYGQYLCYYVYGDNPSRIPSIEIHEETFEEAKNILSQ
ncbi:MAG TPA: hypothetical protein VIH61_04455 [Waddliaceae bacterium]